MSTRVTMVPKEAADILGVSVAFIYKEMGRLTSLKFGARRLIHQNDLNAYIAARCVLAHQPTARPVDDVNRRRLTKAAA